MMKKIFLAIATAVNLAMSAAGANPEALYLIGAMNYWTLPTDEYVLTQISDGVYTGTFNLNFGELEFKIFTINETAWDNPSLYFGTTNMAMPLYSNMPAEMPMAHDLYGNFSCSNWEGGSVTITADLNKNVLTLSSADQPELYEPDEVYVVGDMNGWATPDTWDNFNNFTLHRDLTSSLSPMVYMGEFDVAAGDLNFKLFTKATDWDHTEYYMGCSSDSNFQVYSDASATVRVSSNSSGNIICSNWEGGKVIMTLDLYNGTLNIKGPDQPVDSSLPYRIYLVGAPQGWDINKASMILYPDSEDNGVFSGTFRIGEGDAVFRFYTALGNWDEHTLGIAKDDSPEEMLFEEGLTTPFVFGKGAWNFTNWPGGVMHITINFYEMTATFESGYDQLYLIGTPQGWDITDSGMPLKKVKESSNIFSACYDIPAAPIFRFYTQLGSWSEEFSIGSQYDDQPIEIKMNPRNIYTGSAIYGKGSWSIPGWEGGKMTLTVNLDDMTVDFRDAVAGISLTDEDGDMIRKDGDLLLFGAETEYSIINAVGVTVITGRGVSVDLSDLAKGIYIVRTYGGADCDRSVKIAL